MRAITATIMVLACLALLVVLGQAAWLALSDLPDRSAISEAVVREQKSAPAAAAPPPASPQQTASQQAGTTPTEERPAPNTPGSNVRFVERDGIVGIRIDGPLQRAPAPERERPPPPPPKIEPDLYRLVVIESAGLIDVRSHKVRLAHIDALATDDTCQNADGSRWPCGMRARTALRRLIRRRAIACIDPETAAALKAGTPPPTKPEPSKGEVRMADCTVGNTDLSEWLLANGWAEPTQSAPAEWQALNAEAIAEGRGRYASNGR